MYNFTLVPYSRKSKYRSHPSKYRNYQAPFEYPLAFKMATKANSTRSGDSNNSLFSRDMHDFTWSTFAHINKKFRRSYRQEIWT